MTIQFMASTLLFVIALLTLFFWVAFAIVVYLGNRRTRLLKDIMPFVLSPAPKVSVIIPACNEERNITEALQSILQQDYANLEIIVINDRSVDATGDILNRLAFSNPQLRVFHLTDLPAGWLGKNRALNYGADQASGAILLFTDADIVMEPSVISRAVHYLLMQQLDHLTIAMELRMPGALLGMFSLAFGVFFSMYSRYWQARNPRSRAHIGIGGFNMVRAGVYRAIGGHTKIAMRPDDDMKLGKLIKQSGYRQEFMYGVEMMWVEWYATPGEMIRGLEKNSFAGIDYSIFRLVGSTLTLLIFTVLPFAAIFFTHGITRILYAATVILILSCCAYGAGLHHIKRWYAFGFPFASLLFIYIMWRSSLIALRNNGINWRGTHYSLDELRSNRI